MNSRTDISMADHLHNPLAEQLRHAQEQLEELRLVQNVFDDIFLSSVKNSSDLIALIKNDLLLRYVSPSSSVITGFSPDELIGLSCLEHIHTDDVERIRHALGKIIEKGVPKSSIQFRLRHKNGGYIHVDADAIYLPSKSDFGSIIFHYRDITGQKQSELQIILQKKFYEAILDTIYDGVCVSDPGDIITYTNKGFLRIMNAQPCDIIGRDIVRLFSDDPAHPFHGYYRTARSTRTPVHFDSLHAATAAGTDIFLSGWCIPRYANSVFEGTICTFTDISEQHKIKEQLSESETRFRSIVETATDGIITVKGNGEIIFWNSAATFIFGYGEHEVLGKDVFNIMPENIMNTHEGIFADLVRSHTHKNIGTTLDGWAKRKDGTVFPIELSLASWMIGIEVYFTAIVRDITHRKHIEQSLQHSEQELKNLSSRLLNAHEQERKRVAYELHDGLGQILSAAKIGVKTLLGGGDQSHAADRQYSPDNLLNIIQSAIDEVRRISRDLRPSILDDLGIVAAINSLCLDFAMLNSHIAVTRDIGVRDDDIPEQIRIVIYRVTQEACTNIVRHSHADRVTVKLASADSALQLIIHDNGTGFDVQALHKGMAGGRGLGLSSMKERVEFSGGTFTLTSSPGRGTTVQALWQQTSTDAS